MDTRTSPARLRIERIQERCARMASPRCWCRRATRTSPSTCRSAGRGGSGCRASPARWARWSSPPSDAALFADSRYWVQAEPELAGSGIELVRIPSRHRAVSTSTGSRANVPRGETVGVDGSVLGLAAARHARRRARRARHRPAHRLRRRSPRSGPSARRLPSAAGLRAPRAGGAARARRQAGRRCARR